jgi:hypothetical protein
MPIAGDPLTDAIKLGQLFGIDVDHLVRPGPLVAPRRHRWLQVFQPHQALGFESTVDGGKRDR